MCLPHTILELRDECLIVMEIMTPQSYMCSRFESSRNSDSDLRLLLFPELGENKMARSS